MAFLVSLSRGALAAMLLIFTVSFGAEARAAALANLPAVSPAVDCAALASINVDAEVGAHTTVTSAATGRVGGADYCRIRGVIAPHIQFELRLPTSGWTQRFLQVGCGGLCGVLNIHSDHDQGCEPADSHALALASTDMGHAGRFMGDGSFGNDPQARIDFAYRGVHLTALASKALIKAYYGQTPRFSYFSGCSDGGREALMEVQRFPGDFNGVAAGAPAMNFQVQNSFYHAWMARSNLGPDGKAILTAEKLPALHAAALAACDAADGLKDGEIEDPRACRFDPAVIQCKPGETPTSQCLTAAQVDVVRKFYAGPTDAAGHHFTIGGPQVGSELAWQGVYVNARADEEVMSVSAALGTLKYLSFPVNPPESYTLADFRFDEETFGRLAPLHALYDATDPDITAFQSRGGKLIIWHGWSDPHISPINSIAYFEAVKATIGEARQADALRLFLFPGLYHCGGGDGLSQFDVLTPLMAWVESGAAPDRIVAGRAAFDAPFGGPPPPMPPRQGPPPEDMRGPPDMPAGLPPIPVNRRRPVFAYPNLAHYAGAGSIDEPQNFVAKAPDRPAPGRYDWEGAGFMTPGFHKDCAVKGGALVCVAAAPGG